MKFGQTLKEEAADQRTNVIADQEFKLLLQRIASERNVPYDLLEELIRNMPKGGGGGGDGGNDPGGSGPSGSNDPGSGGGGGGSQQPPDESGPEDEPPPSGLGPFMSNFRPGTGGNDWKTGRKRDDNQDPPAPAATLRSNLEIEAQIQELRDELRKQNRQEKIVREIVQAPRDENPIKKIIRVFHQII